ncbi:hypothetical protein G8E05_06890 [Clostridium botulinum]|nr:hypothetical protein G8E05_06890 [Clostridium botulinum]WGZ46149.1 hypothetical protein HEQ52_07705 [Clostridium botulinum]
MKARMEPLLGKKSLIESILELLIEMNCFMNVLFIFTVLKLRLFKTSSLIYSFISAFDRSIFSSFSTCKQ